MANTQTLFDYLMVVPPSLPIQNECLIKEPNTTNDTYSPTDITSVNHWPEFTYDHIMQQYAPLLQSATIASEPMPDSPPQPIRSGRMFAAQFNTYIQSRLRRALRAGFQYLSLDPGQSHSSAGLTPITVDAAITSEKFRLDIAFFEAGRMPDSSPNRCPGVLKGSWEWRSSWRMTAVDENRREYAQVLSQVNFYMKQNNTRYGFVLTDTELVPIKRLDGEGNLLLASSIPWTTPGKSGGVTVLLGLWYLGMLAAAEDGWRL